MRLRSCLWLAGLLLIVCVGVPAARADAQKKGLQRFPFPPEAYAKPSGVFNAAAVWTGRGLLAMFRQASLVCSSVVQHQQAEQLRDGSCAASAGQVLLPGVRHPPHRHSGELLLSAGRARCAAAAHS